MGTLFETEFWIQTIVIFKEQNKNNNLHNTAFKHFRCTDSVYLKKSIDFPS